MLRWIIPIGVGAALASFLQPKPPPEQLSYQRLAGDITTGHLACLQFQGIPYRVDGTVVSPQTGQQGIQVAPYRPGQVVEIETRYAAALEGCSEVERVRIPGTAP